MQNDKNRIKKYVTRGTIIVSIVTVLAIGLTFGWVAFAQWIGPAAPVPGINGLESILDADDLVSLSLPSEQSVQGPIKVYSNGDYPAILGYAPDTVTTAYTSSNITAWGRGASIAIPADNRPVIGYYIQDESVNRTIVIRKCVDAQCTDADIVYSKIEAGITGAGVYVSVAIGVDGNPLIAYTTGPSLKLIDCSDQSCNTTPVVRTVMTGATFGEITLEKNPVTGSPTFLISTSDTTTEGIYALVCSTVDCSEGAYDISSPSVKVVRSGYFSSYNWGYPSVDFIGSNPAFSFYGNIGRLYYGWCDDSGCSTGAFSALIRHSDTEEIAVGINANNKPLVVYTYDPYDTTIRLYSTECIDSVCTSRSSDKLLDTGDYGWSYYPVMKVRSSDGFPVIAYTHPDSTAGAGIPSVNLVLCGNADCTSLNTTVEVDNNVEANFLDMALDENDRPVIVYFDRFSCSQALPCNLVVTSCSNESCDASIAPRIGTVGIGMDGLSQGYLPPEPFTPGASIGVYGLASGNPGYGLYALTDTGVAVYGRSDSPGGFAGSFSGSVEINDNANATSLGTLSIANQFSARYPVVVNRASKPSVSVDQGSVSGAALYGIATGSSSSGAGVHSDNTGNPAIRATSTNQESAALGISLTSHGVFGYSGASSGVYGEGLVASTQAQGAYGEGYNYGLYGYSKFDVVGSLLYAGGSSATWETGVGIMACGTSNAAEFGDIYVEHGIGMGIATNDYIKDAGGTVIGKYIVPKSLLTKILIDDLRTLGGPAPIILPP